MTTVRILIEAWKLMVGRLPSGRIEHSDGVASCMGNVTLPFMNLSFLDRPALDLRKALEIAERRAASCPHPACTVLCKEWMPPDWENIARSHGLSSMMTLTGMSTAELLPARRPAPDLEFQRIASDAAAAELARINASGYDMPFELFDSICNMNLWHDDSPAFLAMKDGKAVSAAAALPVDGTIYIALVATLPEAQGKGYAEATIRHTVKEAQKTMGATRLTLHASDAGAPLYRSMGFTGEATFALLAAAA